MPKKKMTFEDSVKRIDEITELLENSQTSLDDAIKLFEEGSRIAAECSQILKNAELSVKKFAKESENG